MINILKIIILALINLLPDSPFQTIIDGISYDVDFLPTLNWFLPFDVCAYMTLVWIHCIVVYYMYVVVKKIVMDYIIKKVFTSISIGSISGGS